MLEVTFWVDNHPLEAFFDSDENSDYSSSYHWIQRKVQYWIFDLLISGILFCFAHTTFQSWGQDNIPIKSDSLINITAAFFLETFLQSPHILMVAAYHNNARLTLREGVHREKTFLDRYCPFRGGDPCLLGLVLFFLPSNST